nr:PREDICTED: cyclin-T2-like [Bemisia tabaci]XP_018910649.1 PREDICTED: cyclin-T2-like [Bemisia tabaci]XP_018910650.1 PREDICTED: cyclin-T2-like [Bemisia tabaci]
MAAEKRWFFTKEQLENSPSRRCGYDAAKELSCRQQAANLIQDMGQRLHVNQLCINTAMVYMHRFFVFHSFTHFHRNHMATAALFLACKVEEQPRKLEYVIKVSQLCLMKNHQHQPLDVRSEEYLQQAADLVMNENVLLQTLGFDVGIDHPHTHIVRCCHLVRASKDLAQTSYFMATNSLHLTTMCLQYKPTVVACFCIHLACKWSNWEIPQSNEGKPWFWYVDKTVTLQLLEQLTSEFLSIFDKCPSRLKKRIYQQNSTQNSLSHQNFSLDMDASRKSLSSTNSGVSFQQPISLADQAQSSSNVGGGSTMDKRREREHANIANLRQSYMQPASVSSSLHKKTTQSQSHSAHKESFASHMNPVKHEQQQQLQHQLLQQQQQQQQQQPMPQQQPEVKPHANALHQHPYPPSHQHQQQHHLSGRQNSVGPVKVKLEPGLQKMNLVPSQETEQHSSDKAGKVAHMPSLSRSGGGYPRNGTLSHPPELETRELIKKEPVDSQQNVNSYPRIKSEPVSNSNSHYQKHSNSSSSISSSQSSDVISSVLKEVTSSSFTSDSSLSQLSQNSVQSQQETVKVKQERLSPVQTAPQKSHSIFSPEFRSPPKYESSLAHNVKKEPSEEVKKSHEPIAPATPVTPTTPTNSHRRPPLANTPELVPVVPRLESISGFKNIIDKNKMSVTLSNDIANSTYVPTNNSASISSATNVDYRSEDESIDDRFPSATNAENQHFVKGESSSNNSVPPITISGSSHHKKKKKNKDKDKEKSKHHEHKSEHKKHRKKHKEKDKRRDKEKDSSNDSKHKITNDQSTYEPIKITIPKNKLGGSLPSTSSLKMKLSTVTDDRQKDRHKERDRDRDRDYERERDKSREQEGDYNPIKIKISKDLLQPKNSSRKRERSHDSYNSSSSSAPPSKKYFQE